MPIDLAYKKYKVLMEYSPRLQADLCTTPLAIQNNSVTYKPGLNVSESWALQIIEYCLIIWFICQVSRRMITFKIPK